jgi:hypothetical protein
MRLMAEAVPELDKAAQSPNRNRGWFRLGDRRINREGRPRGSSKRAAEEDGSLEDRAPCADRLMRVLIEKRDLIFRLTHEKAIWMKDLPNDAEMVSCRLDAGQRIVVLTVRSKMFPRIAKGAVIPRFWPQLDGKKWMPGR